MQSIVGGVGGLVKPSGTEFLSSEDEITGGVVKSIGIFLDAFRTLAFQPLRSYPLKCKAVNCQKRHEPGWRLSLAERQKQTIREGSMFAPWRFGNSPVLLHGRIVSCTKMKTREDIQ